MMRKLASVTNRLHAVAEHRLGEAELMLGNPLAAPNLENQKAGQDSGKQNQQAADQQFLTSAAFHLPGAGIDRLAQSIFRAFIASIFSLASENHAWAGKWGRLDFFQQSLAISGFAQTGCQNPLPDSFGILDFRLFENGLITGQRLGISQPKLPAAPLRPPLSG